MSYLAGILTAVIALAAAVIHLNQNAQNFWDFVAFACVTGGTVAVTIITFPWQYRRDIARSFVQIFRGGVGEDRETLENCIEFFRTSESGRPQWSGPVQRWHQEVLRDGAELIGLGFSAEKVHAILEERIHQTAERSQKISTAVRALAKYPPAFGLAGTVLGLVSLMRKVSEGADARETGLTMAIALMATFYGLLTANLIINPTGEKLAKNSAAERKSAEIALQTVMLCLSQSSLLEAQEVLNSYVPAHQRIDVLAGSISAAS